MNFNLAITYISSLSTKSLHPPISIPAQHITIALQELGFDAINVTKMTITCPSHAEVQCKQPSCYVCVLWWSAPPRVSRKGWLYQINEVLKLCGRPPMHRGWAMQKSFNEEGNTASSLHQLQDWVSSQKWQSLWQCTQLPAAAGTKHDINTPAITCRRWPT
jgi:hypothetical protein